MLPFLQLVEKWSMLTFLVSSMLAMGLQLSLLQICDGLRNIRFVLVALFLNFVFAPAFAWLITVTIPLDQGYAVGLLLLGGAAGAPFLPRLVQIARGDLARAASLMVLLTAVTILFLPFALPVFVRQAQADPWQIAKPLLVLIVLPLVVGITVKCLASVPAAKAAPILGFIGNASLFLFFILLVALNFRVILDVIGTGAIVAAVLYILGLLGAGWLLGGSNFKERGVMALAAAARNFGAALVPASSLQDPKISVMLIVCAIAALVVSFFAAAWMGRQGEKGVASA